MIQDERYRIRNTEYEDLRTQDTVLMIQYK